MKLQKLISAFTAGIVAASLMTLSSYAEDIVLFEGEASCSSWGQAWEAQTIKNDGGTFDPELLQPGSAVYVTYTGVTPELIMQSWSGGEGWAKVTSAEDDGSVAAFVYDDFVSSYKTDDFSNLDKLIVGAADGDVTVKKITLGSGSAEKTTAEEATVEDTTEESSPLAEDSINESEAADEEQEVPVTEEETVEIKSTEDSQEKAVQNIVAETGDTNEPTTASKGSADTGIEGTTVIFALSIIGTGAVILSKKKK